MYKKSLNIDDIASRSCLQ